MPIPREDREALFRSQGMKNPQPRLRMLDGFNEGWIAFPDNGEGTLKGTTSLADVVAALTAGTEA
ncbi:hypothetical protein ACWGTO_26735 [Mesorhizobium sp. PL10]